MEPLNDRTMLAVTFEFTIDDPSGKYNKIVTQLQKLLDAAGHEWSTHLNGTAKLEYIVGIVDSFPPEGQVKPGVQPTLANGSAKSAAIVRTDPITLVNTFQVGTALEIDDGIDRNGTRPDAGITIWGKNLGLWYFEEDTNTRSAPIPEQHYDGYTVLLHEIAHTLGFASMRNALGDIPSLGQFVFDEHINVLSPGFYSFGNGFQNFDPFTGEITIDPSSDDAFKVYQGPVSLQIGNPAHLGTGRFVDPGFINQFPDFFVDQFFVDDLQTDLMSGLLNPGDRRAISKLDLAMLQDAEVPVNLTPEQPEGLYPVNGTGLSDRIDVSLSNGTLLIRVNNSVTSFTPEQSANISSIVINGLNGNDTITVTGNFPGVAINGGAGADTIYGGPKADALYGGGGHDLIVGGPGNDLLRGGDGNDTVLGQGGSDRILGDAGADILNGGVQTDRISGGPNGDTLIGATEDDFLFGDSGNDVISGAGGKDRMEGGSGSDIFYGGAGNDSVDYSRSQGPVTASIDGSPDDGVDGEGDNIIDSENIIGSSFGDVLIGSEGSDGLIGGAGNDTILGAGGNDFLEGNNGNDVLDGGGGHDNLQGGDGNDEMIGGTGLDVFFGGLGDDTFSTGDGEVDTINGDDGQDTVTGDEDDELFDVEVADLGPGGRNQPDRVMTAPSRKVTFS
jgi:Ca2+-binding RTX toxin-like protein